MRTGAPPKRDSIASSQSLYQSNGPPTKRWCLY
jgi:hypothetical protein